MPSPGPALLILAAGLGSRYGGLKQIDPVGPSGETVLDYSVFDALRAGFTDIVFVIRRDFETEFRQQIGRRFEARFDVRYVFQEIDLLPAGHTAPAGRTKPWGTGHAVWCAAEALHQPFAVINADDFYGADAFRQLAGFLNDPRLITPPLPACMIGYELAKTLSDHGSVSRGVCCCGDQAELLSVEEYCAIKRTGERIQQLDANGAIRNLTGREIVSMNCWGFYPAVFPQLEQRLREFLVRHGANPTTEFQLPGAVSDLIDRNECAVRVLSTGSSWFGVTYRQDHAHVVSCLRRLVGSGSYPERLWGNLGCDGFPLFAKLV